MKHLTLLFLLLIGPLLTAQTDTPCPAGDCPCMLQKADNLAQNPATFSKALNYYFAVTACDENLRDEVEIQIEALFVRIEQLRKNEEKANRTARMALHDANAARVTSDSLYRVAEVQRKKAEDVLNRIYFYKDRFGLAYREDKYGFIDADLTEKIPFKYEEALPFDESGFARVKRRNKNDYSAILDFLIDTLGTEYRVSSDYEELTPDIVALDLRNLGLDSLPAAVWRHKPLKILLLNNNNLYKLPDSIGRLTNLIYLDLRYTRLSAVPNAIGWLTQLTNLDLSGNYLSSIPPEIGMLTQLTDLDLSNTQTDTLPDEICNLTRLTWLDLSENVLTRLPDHITRLTRLVELNLNHTFLTRLPDDMDAFAELQKLDIARNQLTELPPTISSLTRLSEFNLYLNEIEELPADLGKLTRLTHLDMSQNLIAELPPGFGNLTRLTFLDANENSLTQLPDEIRQLKSLVEMDLDDNPLEEVEINRLRVEMPWCKITWEQMDDDALIERHFYPQAYAYQVKQVAENPEDVDLYSNLIIYAFLAGKPEAGRRAAKRIIELGADEQSADIFLAVGYLANSQWPEFEKLCLKWKGVVYNRRPSMKVTDGILQLIDILIKEMKVSHPDFERAKALLKE